MNPLPDGFPGPPLPRVNATCLLLRPAGPIQGPQMLPGFQSLLTRFSSSTYPLRAHALHVSPAFPSAHLQAQSKSLPAPSRVLSLERISLFLESSDSVDKEGLVTASNRTPSTPQSILDTQGPKLATQTRFPAVPRAPSSLTGETELCLSLLPRNRNSYLIQRCRCLF